MHKGLMTDGKAELDIGFDFSCVHRSIIKAELNGAACEHAVQIQRTITAVVIVHISPAVSVIPHPLKAFDTFRFLPVQFI